MRIVPILLDNLLVDVNKQMQLLIEEKQSLQKGIAKIDDDLEELKILKKCVLDSKVASADDNKEQISESENYDLLAFANSTKEGIEKLKQKGKDLEDLASRFFKRYSY